MTETNNQFISNDPAASSKIEVDLAVRTELSGLTDPDTAKNMLTDILIKVNDAISRQWFETFKENVEAARNG